MSVTIPRHSSPGPDDEAYATFLGESVMDDVQRLERSPGSLDMALGTALLHLQARAAVDPRAAKLETWEAAVTAMQIHSALFAVTGSAEGTVQCRIAHEVRTLPAIGPRSYADPGNWLTAFWLAVICRDQKRLTALCDVPVERLRAASDGAFDAYVYHWVAALQAYWLQRPDLVDELTAALENSQPDIAALAPRDLLQHILYPPLNLFYRFLRQDAPGFNQALAEAVELHKAYWTADEDRTNSPSGMVALGPLAMACLAHDGGLPLDVESDYLPKHLLERGWLGEFEV
ncbi:immunity 49 family protein [Streptomyces sp. YKOK-I1]